MQRTHWPNTMIQPLADRHEGMTHDASELTYTLGITRGSRLKVAKP